MAWQATEPVQDLTRPARKQVERPVITEPSRGGGGGGGGGCFGNVNIWTGRRAGERPQKRGERARSDYRCRPALDTGRTRGSDGRVNVFCSYFARGLCAEGPACRYLHRLPTAADAAAHVKNNSQDIFGRERLPDHLDNRCGAGSYDRDSRALYVAYDGAAGYAADELRHLLAANFGEWGPLRAPPFVVPSKAIAFVRYHWRASAEFAKEAMHGQGLDGSKFEEVLSVRWASDDPNPGAVAARKRGAEDALGAAALAAWDALPAEERRARLAALRLAQGRALGEAASEYPDTDSQYQRAAGQAGQQGQEGQQQWGPAGPSGGGGGGDAYPDTDWQYAAAAGGGGQGGEEGGEQAGRWVWDAAAGQWAWQWHQWQQEGGAAAAGGWGAQHQQHQHQQQQQQAQPGPGQAAAEGEPAVAASDDEGGCGAAALGLLADYGSDSEGEGGAAGSGGGGEEAAAANKEPV